MKLLEKKVAIITGGSRGIGKGIAEIFIENRCSVAITYNSSKAEAEKLVNKYDAVKFAKLGSEIIGGKGGGGRKDFAQAGGQDQNKIDEAFDKIKSLI